MKILNEKPPVWSDVCAAFKILPKNVLFTYGDTIYNPDAMQIPADLYAHEEVHAEQQKHDENEAALWWGKYLRDPGFRLDQEVEAYARQYATMCGFVKDRNRRARFLFQIAASLSGPLYDHVVGHSDAMSFIKARASILK